MTEYRTNGLTSQVIRLTPVGVCSLRQSGTFPIMALYFPRGARKMEHRKRQYLDAAGKASQWREPPLSHDAFAFGSSLPCVHGEHVSMLISKIGARYLVT